MLPVLEKCFGCPLHAQSENRVTRALSSTGAVDSRNNMLALNKADFQKPKMVSKVSSMIKGRSHSYLPAASSQALLLFHPHSRWQPATGELARVTLRALASNFGIIKHVVLQRYNVIVGNGVPEKKTQMEPSEMFT